ncbi:hypothetical protein E2C01_033038 [Portunus trituberculatus]|uniref:Uncharacterized protein n=1 Tax=Portunus trituberculatus TaxID=210409 RepID=A0A5B7EWS6_PORTR|nr:hypothetical protein [Portunus trituberculatus]
MMTVVNVKEEEDGGSKVAAWWVTAVRDTRVPGGVAGDEAVRGGTEGSGRVRRESAVCEAATAFVSLSGCSAECAAALRMRGMRPARCPDRLHTAVNDESETLAASR